MAGDRSKAGNVSPRLRMLNRVLRRVVRPRLVATRTPEQACVEFNRFAGLFLKRPPHLLRLVQRGSPDIHWISSGPTRARRVILYFHGGAYIAGSPLTHQGMLGRLSAMCGVRVAAPRYRLAPTYKAPAQFEDAVAAHAALLALGYPPQSIVLGGDSAGGGLAFALLSDLCARNLRPAGIFAFSPWVDLTLSGDSLRTNAEADPFLPADRVAEVVAFTLGKASPTDPRVSPLLAEFDKPPPAQLLVGSTEILRSDAERLADRLEAAGGAVALRESPEAPHVWPLFDGYIPEAREALEEVARFVSELP